MFSHGPVAMPNHGRHNSQKFSQTCQDLAANPLNTEQTNYCSMASEALRLLLAQHNLVQTGTCQHLNARLETHLNNSLSGVVTVTDTSSSTNTLPQEELAQIISLLIDEKLTIWQDSSQKHNHLVPTPHTRSPFNGSQSSYAKSYPRWRPTTTTERRYTAASLSCLQPI